MIELSPEQARILRARAQYLLRPAPRESLDETVRAVVGIQAQSHPALQLALRARVGGLTLDDVQAALGERRRLVRTWLMRSTLHLAAADDARWLAGLLGPIFIPGGRRRRLQLGLDDETAARGVAAIRAILAERGSLTRDELVAALNERGLGLDRKSQGPIHLIGLAGLQGVVCYGANTEDGDETYALFEEWAGPPDTHPTPDALAELARRYVRGYGPASLRDFAGWSGLKITAVRQAWQAITAEQAFTPVQVGGVEMLAASAALESLDQQPGGGPVVRLLPAFDAYVLGYADRELVVRSEYQGEVYHGGQTVPVVLVDGEAAGVWRYQRQGKRLRVTARAFESFGPEVERRIAEEADDIGRFWEIAEVRHQTSDDRR